MNTIDGYTPLVPLLPFPVEALFSVHYFEYASTFLFPGETHDFWEFLYVDKGEVDTEVGGQLFQLARGEILFIPPGQHHDVRANGRVAPNLVVASFACQSPEMAWFAGQVLPCSNEEQLLMARIIDEAAEAFCSPLGDPFLTALGRREGSTLGSEQLIRNYLEILLIQLYRGGQAAQAPVLHSHPREVERQELLDEILHYFDTHADKRLSLQQICQDNLVGRSQIQKLFREKTGCGVMEYFGRMKVEAARRMIREGRSNFTEIAQTLGYTSIHYFSRHFKKISGMTPSEYASSVQALRAQEKQDGR